MAEIQLTRSSDDRRRFELGDIGSLRVPGFLSRNATAEADGTTWTFCRRGAFDRAVQAVDSAGAVVGLFEPRTIRRGGILRWNDREWALRPASSWRERYALADGDREVAVFDGKGWGRRPVVVTVDDDTALEPCLLLFGAFVVRRLAADADATTAAAASTAATGG